MHAASEPLRAGASSRRPTAALAAIVAAGFGIRLLYLLASIRTPGYTWGDPDGYLEHALMLARPDGWHWTFDVAKYVINGQQHALPPLYSIFLSIVALFPGLPVSALLAQTVLSTISIALMFVLGRTLHSSAAGLWASAGYALSAPAILNVWSTSQETLYIPLLLFTFVLYGRALKKDVSPWGFAPAGAVLGLAALTRSMPIFFVGPLAVLHVAIAADRRAALRQAAGYLAGFAIVVVPYCAGLSRSLGQLTLIDSHGSIHIGGGSDVQQAPGLAATAQALWGAMTTSPGAFLQDCAGRARTLLYVNGGRQLQIYVVAATKSTAILWKVLVHLGTDALLIAAAVLAWPGAVLCRNTRLALTFVLWAVLNIAVASLGGFGGARLRAPFEPLLIVLGAVVLAGGWRARPRWVITLAAAVAVLMAIVVVPQLPRSFRSWPDYGVRWSPPLSRAVGTIQGTGGFNVPAYDGVAKFRVEPVTSETQVQVDLRADGVTVRSLRLSQEDRSIGIPWPRRGLAFVELHAFDAATRTPATVRVDVAPR